MKKELLKAGIVAGIATVTLCAVNWVFGMMSGKILGLTFWGGEYKACCGFGVRMETFYPLYTVDDPVPPTSEMVLDPVSLIVTLVIIWTVVFVMRRNKT